MIKIKAMSPNHSEEEEEEVELKGQMKVIGRMFRKKLLEMLNANAEEKKKLDWFANTKAKTAKGFAEMRALRKLA
jgi:hypothetical protein